MQRSAFEAEQSTASRRPARGRPAYALHAGSLVHHLGNGPMLLGRGTGVDILLTGPLVSRRHAELRETADGLVVVDLGSRNGVFVNGHQIGEPTPLSNGDTLEIGDHAFVVVEGPASDDQAIAEPQVPRESSRVPAGTYESNEVSIATRRANALRLVGSVAEKALARGQAQHAEHIIGSHLVATLSDATTGRGVAPEVARSAAQYAVKLAAATGKAAWLDFAFRLYHALGETIPLPIVDEMYTVLAQVPGLDLDLLRSYSDFLRTRGAASSIPERFVLQRLEGLERLAAWHA